MTVTPRTHLAPIVGPNVTSGDNPGHTHSGVYLPAATKLDDLAAPDDNTDLDVSTSRHGLTPKAPNDTAKFLRGDAAWAAPTATPNNSGQRLCLLDPTCNTTRVDLQAWAFTSGGTYEVVAGDVITGATSSKTATVWGVYKTSGTWAGGDAAGWAFISGSSGTFTSGENWNVGASNNVATGTGTPTANVATFDARSSIPVVDYDTTTPEVGWYLGHLNRVYGGGGIDVRLHVALTSATSGNVGWLIAFRRLGSGSLDLDLATGWTAPVVVTAETVPDAAGKSLIMAAKAIANGTAMASIAAGELFQIALIRDTPTDTAAGDAELLLIEITEQ